MMVFENRFLRIVDSFYCWFIKIGSNLQSVFLLYMRLMWGHRLFLHGLKKFTHSETVIQFFSSLDIVFPTATTYSVAFFETVCGLFLFLGFMSRLASIPIIIIMASALSIAHSEVFTDWKFLFEPMMLVCQAPYPFIITAFLVLIFGPGRVSIDAWLKRWAGKQPKY